ncbi:MAG: BUD32 family EKC/KEOPS complex subunit [Candidatus Methanofastidiosia archaeon]
MKFNTVKKFKSRKNNVFLIEKDNKFFIYKRYATGEKKTEWQILKLCKKNNVPVPEPIEHGKDFILLEYLNGQNMADMQKISQITCGDLAHWLFSFHEVFPSKMRGDAILRNFILFDKHIFGIDFEETGDGDRLKDISMLCASILTHDPIFTSERFICVSLVIEEYEKLWCKNIKNRVLYYLKNDLEKIANRRTRKKDEILYQKNHLSKRTL